MSLFDTDPEVVGKAAEGSVPEGNPVRVGGSDGSAIRTFKTDTEGKLYVANPGGVPSHTDDSAFSIGVDDVSPIAALADETGPDSVDEGDAGLVRMSTNRVLYTILRDGQGNERGAYVNSSNELAVEAHQVTGSNLHSQVAGEAATGASPVGNPVYVAGSDGSLLRALLVDTSGRAIVVGAAANGAAAAGNPVQVAGCDCTGNARVFSLMLDNNDGIYRLQIAGKVQLTSPSPPPSGTAVAVAADNPLAISTTNTTEYVIPNGKTLVVQQVNCGAEGDPTEKGSKVEVIYYDGSTEHLIERIYITGFTTSVYPDTDKARDGTTIGPGDGSTKKLYVRRIRMSGSTQEVDAVVRGYVV